MITGSTYRFNWYDGLDVTISISYDNQVTYTPIVENHTTEIDLQTEGQQECYYDWTVSHPESEEYYHNDEVYYKILDNNTGEEEIKGPIIIEDDPQLTTIVVFPPFTRVEYLKTKQFTAVGYDQIGRALDTQPEFTWSVNTEATATINQQGLLTAGVVEEEVTVTATVGEISGTAKAIILEKIINNGGMLMSLSATFNNENVEILNVTPVGLDVYILYKTDDGIVKMSKKCLDTSKTSTTIATSATSE